MVTIRTPAAAVVICLAGFFLCFSLQKAVCQEGTPASGVILVAEGDVLLRGGSGHRGAAVGMPIQPGDTLVVAAGGQCEGFSPDGDRFELIGPAELILEEAGAVRMMNGVAGWLRDLISRWIGEERRQVLTTRSISDWETGIEAPPVVMPAQGGAVRPGETRLRWIPLPGIDQYKVTLAFDGGEEIHRTVSGQSIIIPDLAPGTECVWKVQPAMENWTGLARWHSFRVIEAEEEKALDNALRGFDDLEAGFVLLSTGLHQEALDSFDRALLSGDHPRSASLWKARVLAEMGLYREAYETLWQVSVEGAQ
jgi:hypothetical protein